MNDAQKNLRRRTRDFALAVVRLFAQLPRTTEAQVIGRQFIRSGTSPGAHYREACRARSTAEFISKMEVGIQELDETDYWLELLIEGGITPTAMIEPVKAECDELIAIFVSSVKRAKQEI
jgi:four helix bundle protein